jgi:D-methionine transport system permease protein
MIGGLLPPELVAVLPEFRQACWETFIMVAISMTAALLFGTPLGVLLNIYGRGGLVARRGVSEVLGWLVNVVRSFPFIVLVIAIIPFTRVIVGTAIGPYAAAVPLSIAAVPFFARLVEQSLREVPRGLAESAVASGSSNTQVVRKVLIPEAMPSLIGSFTTTVISFIAFSAVAGLVGGGGIGDLAIRYGYNRFIDSVMWACVIVLVIAVQVVQFTGSALVRVVDKR